MRRQIEATKVETIAEAIVICMKCCDLSAPNNVIAEIINDMELLRKQYAGYSYATALYHHWVGNTLLAQKIQTFIADLQNIIDKPMATPKFLACLERIETFFRETAWFDQCPNINIINIFLHNADILSNPITLKKLLLEKEKPGQDFCQEFELVCRAAKNEHAKRLQQPTVLAPLPVQQQAKPTLSVASIYPNSLFSFAVGLSHVWGEAEDNDCSAQHTEPQDNLDQVLDEMERAEQTNHERTDLSLKHYWTS